MKIQGGPLAFFTGCEIAVPAAPGELVCVPFFYHHKGLGYFSVVIYKVQDQNLVYDEAETISHRNLRNN